MTNNLLSNFSQVAAEWDTHKNGQNSPDQVHPGSHNKAWWICDKGHSWDAVIRSRTKGKTGCPFCSGRRVNAENNLGGEFPEIAKQWHPSLNGKYLPLDFTSKNGAKVWWLCDCGHEWEASIGQRTNLGSGCPSCAKLKRRKTNPAN